MTEPTDRAARIDQLRDELRSARCCDAVLVPCPSCQDKVREVRELQRAARRESKPPRVPAPRRPTAALVRRLFRA